MKKITLLKDKYLYKTKLNNLNIYIYSDKNYNSTFLSMNVKVGSVNTKFKYNNKIITLPNGTAHFLEHKLFDKKNNINTFLKFESKGSYINAYTSYNKTVYELLITSNINKNINSFLDFIYNPYFTSNNIKNEINIIKEEINLDESNIDKYINNKLEENLNIKDNHKYKVTGTIKDIKKITKYHLYSLYKAYYQNKNMILVITTKEDINTIYNILNMYFKNKKNIYNKVRTIKYKDKLNILKKYDSINKNNIDKLIKMGIKLDKTNYKDKSNIKIEIIFNIILYSLFEESSDFYEYLINNKILYNIDYNFEIRDYLLITIQFNTKYEIEAINSINTKLESIAINNKELNRIKKVFISDYINTFNNIKEINYLISNNLIKYNKYIDYIKEVENITIKDINNIIENINIDNQSIFVIK